MRSSLRHLSAKLKAHGHPACPTTVGLDVPSVGHPLGDFRVRIVDDDGKDLATGEIGEILLRGTTVTPGYLDEKANAESLRDGWLSTGDLGILDEEGRLYITGRKKDLIIYQGKNFYGHDVAASVAELPVAKVGHSYAFSVDVDGVERVVVMLTPAKADGDEFDPETIRETVKRHVLRSFGLPVDDVILVPRDPEDDERKGLPPPLRAIYREALTA